MSDSSVDVVREICDVLDTLVLMVKLDHAPMWAVWLLERAGADMQACVDKFDRDDQCPPSSS